MSAVIHPDPAVSASRLCTLLGDADARRTIAWRDGKPVSTEAFLADVRHIAGLLPSGAHAINLCEDRYAFIASFCAVASRGQTTLLPPSRARDAVDQALALHADTYVISDVALDPAPSPLVLLPPLQAESATPAADSPLRIGAAQVVAIGFTSGSTGQPKPNEKSWHNFEVGAALNIAALGEAIGIAAPECISVVATVPAQHMYGMEMSVLLPLFGNFAVHAGKPLFPADIARALAEMPAPRLLVTTPVHLRALLREDLELPAIAAIVSATAPLPQDLAALAEARCGAPLIELFGSTETCVIAHRRTALEQEWRLHRGVELRPQPDGTQVGATHLSRAVHLQDVVEVLPGDRFTLRGRNADLLEIAGKRASLGDLTRRLLALPGVVDGVVFQLDEPTSGGVKRIAALVVAPSRTVAELIDALRDQVDPVFLPRPLRRVEQLPRNETGKLPRDALLAALDRART